MPSEKKQAKTYLSPEDHARLEALAGASGQTVSAFLGQVVTLVLEGDGATTAPGPGARASKALREGKVTVRLAEDVRADLEGEAQARGVTVSTWAAAMIRARYRAAPQPLPDDRPRIQRAFRKLTGIAVNANQIAHALNRGVLTGAGAALTAGELRELTTEVGALRREMQALAAGRLRVQRIGGRDE